MPIPSNSNSHRVPSPAQSPSPIPVPSATGGRPPSNAPPAPMTFGSFPGEGDVSILSYLAPFSSSSWTLTELDLVLPR
jgi:translation initiation factor 4G